MNLRKRNNYYPKKRIDNDVITLYLPKTGKRKKYEVSEIRERDRERDRERQRQRDRDRCEEKESGVDLAEW